MRNILSTLPLILFAALLLFMGYALFAEAPPPPIVAQIPTTTPPPTATLPPPSPTATNTPQPTAQPDPSSTPSLTPTPPPPSPTPTQTIVATKVVPTPTVTATLPSMPITFIWVQTSNDLNTPPHRLALDSTTAKNPVMLPHAVAPALSPTGDKVAFYAESILSGFDTGIWVADLVEGFTENHRLLADVTDVQNMVWSTDSEEKLAFEVILNPASPPEEWQSEIRIIRTNSDEGYVELDRFGGRQPAWSPDGQSLVFYTCLGSQCGLFLADCTGGNCDEANGEQLTFDSTDSYPSWSPDGSRLAFASTRDGNHEIYQLTLADQSLQNISNRPTIDTTPIYSPDGQRIFFRTDFEGSWQLQIIDLNGGPIQPFIADIGGDDRDWGLIRPVMR